MTHWLTLLVVLGLFLGPWLMRAGRGLRRSRGLGDGKTVSLDRLTLTSRRLGLTGRPDRLVKSGGTVIIEEWKSARVLQPWHRTQMGVYFLLVEEHFGVKPSHGFLVTGDGARHRIDNEEGLRDWVLAMAAEIRSRRADVHRPIAVNPATWQCRPCGMRDHCGQARFGRGEKVSE